MTEQKGTDLSQFGDGYSEEKKNKLVISETFLERFNLRQFLLDNVLGKDFETEENKETVTINSNEELLSIIVKYLKAKKYIGVGVGGVYIKDKINNSDSREYVLLYKRYHEPENQVWSILGGSSKIHEKIEDTLKEKISRITGISKDAIKVKDIIKANNHEEKDYHFLSPAFYVDISNPNAYLYWGKTTGKNKQKRKVEIISNEEDFKKVEKSTYEKPLLAWVPVDMINGHLTDEEGDNIFSFTTVQAIECHNRIWNTTLQIINATEVIKSYKDWRIGGI